MTIIWYMVPDRYNFCHFGPFFALLPPRTTQKIKILKKWKKHLEILSFYTSVPKMTIIWFMIYGQWYDMWFLKYEASGTEFFVILDCFLPFYPLTHKKYDLILYCSLNMAHNRFNYFSCWAIFCPFTSLTARKIKI